jgi:hypothetical protein
MPQPLRWTDEADALIHDLRLRGNSWDTIARALGTSRWAAIERARLIGAHVPLPPPARATRAVDTGREPLPPGHPATWGALIAGTLLAGAAYPYPPLPPLPEPKPEPWRKPMPQWEPEWVHERESDLELEQAA